MGGNDGKPKGMMAPYAPYLHYYFTGLTGGFGLLGIVNPELMASLAGFPTLAEEQTLWANMIGVVLLGIANLYGEAAMTGDAKLGKLLARGRIAIGGIMISLVVTGKAGPDLLKFGLPDFITGILEYAF